MKCAVNGAINLLQSFSATSISYSVRNTSELEDHVSEHGVSFHAFADDTQLYVHCRRDAAMSAAVRLERCIKEVSHWTSVHRLKLNADNSVALGRITSDLHFASIYSACFYWLRQLSSVRHYLDAKSAAALIRLRDVMRGLLQRYSRWASSSKY